MIVSWPPKLIVRWPSFAMQNILDEAVEVLPNGLWFPFLEGRTESEQTPLGRIRIGGREPSSRPNSSPYWELGLVSGRRQAAQVVSATARPDKDRYSGGPQLDVIAYLGDSI